MPSVLAIILALLAEPTPGPSLRVQCPHPINRMTWDALADALRAWQVPDVAVDVRCYPDGSGRIETRLQGQRAIAELPPHEFGGPERVVEIVEVQVDALMRALGRPRVPPPQWVLRVGAGARVVGEGSLPLMLSFAVDRRFGMIGERGLLRLGLGGSAGATESGGRSVGVIGTSMFALFGVRTAGSRFALDGGLGMRLGLVTLEGASGSVDRPTDAGGLWYGPILQGGAGWLITRRGELRLGVEGGYSFAGPVGQPDAGPGLRHDGGWVALDLALSMAF